MQFIPNGPDIPELMLQSHEDGHLVFFCGAGISYKVGLKDFGWLVDRVYELCGTDVMREEKAAYNNAQFDTTLNILEQRLDGQRQEQRMRQAIATALKPDFSQSGANETHLALLQLGQTKNGALRLVTTNFDRAFQESASQINLQYSCYTAPMLPIPKNSQWDGLVHLHGLVPEDTSNRRALDQLVVTSGDFGLAYLTERWAARFVSELLRNYMVCFVGYSLNDPVLRYMVDALAADSLRGEDTRRAYAIVPYEVGNKEETKENWLTRGVSPILYLQNETHSMLHSTLKVWASDYRDGILGKDRVVTEYAALNPSASTIQDDFVGRMLWALADRSGIPARRFADFNPVPPLTWIQTFSKKTFGHDDLIRFGVPPNTDLETNDQFSLLNRPTPYTHAPWMRLVSGSDQWSRCDTVMYQFARWLTRHLNNPELAVWLAEHGGQLNPELALIIEQQIEYYEKLLEEEKTAQIKEISDQAPDAIPNSKMKTIWRLFITNRIGSAQQRNLDLYGWKQRLKREGLTASLRLELRTLLSPKISLENSYFWPSDDDESDEPDTIDELVNWELVLATDYVHTVLIDELDESSGEWHLALPRLLDEFQLLLIDALDLLGELGRANDCSDRSYLDLPSISPHWQNRRLRDWVALIELLRIAWVNVYENDPDRATLTARKWFELPYPTFKRLALFAASYEECIPPEEWVEWLLNEDARWLWSVESQRETMRLLVLQSHKLPQKDRSRIESEILNGPPREMYRDDIEPSKLESILKSSIWKFLAKFTHDEKLLSPKARSILQSFPPEHPDWRSVREDERVEFPIWTSGTGDPDFDTSQVIDIAPRNWRDLVLWLKQPVDEDRFMHRDSWMETCQTRFFHCAIALCVLHNEGVRPSKRWSEALQVWREKKHLLRSWRFLEPLFMTMPDEALGEISHDLALWLQEVSKSVDLSDEGFFDLSCRLLEVPSHDGVFDGDPVTRALNHPVGMITLATLDYWFRYELNDNDLLAEDFRSIFSRICDPDSPQYIHGRVILASRLIALFRVDREWTETHLLPFFNWSNDANEAKAVWSGFFWSPRIYPPLMIAFKNGFLETAIHYTELGDCGPQYVRCLTFSALEPMDGYTHTDFQRAMTSLPKDAILQAGEAVVTALDSSGENRELYWDNRVEPYWHHVWPKSDELASSELSDTMVRLTVSARGKFPSALRTVIGWLRPIEYVYFVTSKLYESELCGQFPNEALDLMARIIDSRTHVTKELRECLDAVSNACTELEEDHRYRQLDEYLQMRGI